MHNWYDIVNDLEVGARKAFHAAGQWFLVSRHPDTLTIGCSDGTHVMVKPGTDYGWGTGVPLWEMFPEFIAPPWVSATVAAAVNTEHVGCDCGGEKAGTTHARWCSTKGTHGH